MRCARASLAALLLLAGCGDASEPGDRALSAACGLPTLAPRTDDSILPAGFVPEGAEVVRTRKGGGRVSALINAPLGVQQAFDAYMRALDETAYRVVGRDNEGFEAEIYIRKGEELGAIQIRSSRCTDAVLVFVNIVEDPTAGALPTLTPSPRPSRSR